MDAGIAGDVAVRADRHHMPPVARAVENEGGDGGDDEDGDDRHRHAGHRAEIDGPVHVLQFGREAVP